MSESIEFEQHAGVARITLAKPAIHNAFDDRLIADLTQAFAAVDRDPAIRAVVLGAHGKSFSAGADLNWMRRMADYTPAENRADALALAQLMERIDTVRCPVIGRVQGAAFGGGVGLIACCDLVVASDRASFCLSEVRLGLIPAAISPYVVAAIGARAARRYFLTAERFDATTAAQLGLVHEVVAEGELDLALRGWLAALQENGPAAVAEAKRLIRTVNTAPRDDALQERTAEWIATLRAGAEGREGVAAFLDKRRPAWRPEHHPDSTAE